jgi:hypothetical protein
MEGLQVWGSLSLKGTIELQPLLLLCFTSWPGGKWFYSAMYSLPYVLPHYKPKSSGPTYHELKSLKL